MGTDYEMALKQLVASQQNATFEMLRKQDCLAALENIKTMCDVAEFMTDGPFKDKLQDIRQMAIRGIEVGTARRPRPLLERDDLRQGQSG